MILLLNRNKKVGWYFPRKNSTFTDCIYPLCLPETEDFYFHENVWLESFVFYGGKHKNDPVLWYSCALPVPCSNILEWGVCAWHRFRRKRRIISITMLSKIIIYDKFFHYYFKERRFEILKLEPISYY